MPICIDIGSFVFEVQRSRVCNRRTNGQTDGHVENIICPDSLDWRADTVHVRSRYCIPMFYHAERILSAIAKLL